MDGGMALARRYTPPLPPRIPLLGIVHGIQTPVSPSLPEFLDKGERGGGAMVAGYHSYE